MTFAELREALAVLGLGERASLAELRARHRELVRRYHPDAGAEDGEAIRRINAAYRLVGTYCRDYRFDFGHAEFLEQCPQERLREQFFDDPWGKGNEDEE